MLSSATIRHGLLAQLPYLRELTIPFFHVKTLFPLHLESLTLVYKYVNYIAEDTKGTVKDFSNLKTLRFLFEDDAAPNDDAAYVNLDTLPLRELVVHNSGKNFRVQVSHDIRTLKLLDLDNGGPDSLRWLTFTAKNLRHLVLSRMDDRSLPTTPIEFSRIEILELYCCRFLTFQTKMVFPRVGIFSQTHCVFENDDFDPLHIASSFLGTLTLLGLMFYYYRGGNGRIHDISKTYQTLERLQRTSGLKRRLLQGPFTTPPDSTKNWILHEQMIKADPVPSEDFRKRKALLEAFDPMSRLRESQELEKFQGLKL